MFSISFTTLLGLSCITLGVLFIAFSRYREWLVFLFAGMGFWGGLELLRALIQMVFEMPLLYGYISAFFVFLMGVAILLVIRDKQELKKSQHKKANCIEHTPVYEDDWRHYSG